MNWKLNRNLDFNLQRPNNIIQAKEYGTIITEDCNGDYTPIESGRSNTLNIQQLNYTDKSLNKIAYPCASLSFTETTGK